MKNRLLDLLASAPAGSDSDRRLSDALDPDRLKAAAEKWIAENPALALGAALTVGVLVGWLIKRK